MKTTNYIFPNKNNKAVLKPTRFIDHEFVKWISKQRTNKKFFQHGLLQHLSEEQKQLFEAHHEEETLDESDEEICV